MLFNVKIWLETDQLSKKRFKVNYDTFIHQNVIRL